MIKDKLFKTLATCSICNEPMTKDLSIVKKCGHMFHTNCIKDFVDKNENCSACNIECNSSDLLSIVYNIEDIHENNNFQVKYDEDMKKLKLLKTEKKIKENEKQDLQKILKKKDQNLKSMKMNLDHYPENLDILESFPKLKPKVKEVYQKAIKEFPTEDTLREKYCPKENLNSKPKGTYYYENLKVVYYGQYYNKQKHGIGKSMTYKGNLYYGTFKNDCMDGYGLMIKNNGNYIIGEFSENQVKGIAELICYNGDYFKGSWKNGLKDGFGEESSKNGTNYLGDFKEGKKHGKAKVIFPKGNIYIGELKDGKLCGQGNMEFNNGRKYTGEFSEDKINGYGIMYFNEGKKKYTGNWLMNKQHGKGEMHFEDDKCTENNWIYTGEWRDGKEFGNGEKKFNDGKIVSYTNGISQTHCENDLQENLSNFQEIDNEHNFTPTGKKNI